jgi:DNA-binding GntR family transcriptional regulator
MVMTINSSKEAAFIRIAKVIRDDILRGHLLSGMSLIEIELSVKYGASRNTLREALQLLRQQGLVSQEPNKSVRVRRLTVAELKDIFVVRRTVEISALRSAKTLSPEQLTRFSDVVQRASEAKSRSDWQSAGTESLRFHQELVTLHGSDIFNSMFEILVSQLRLVFAAGNNEQAFQEPWLERDAAIFQMLSDGEFAKAADELENYLNDSELLLTAMAASGLK